MTSRDLLMGCAVVLVVLVGLVSLVWSLVNPPPLPVVKSPTATVAPTATPIRHWVTFWSCNACGEQHSAPFSAPHNWRLVWSCDPTAGSYLVSIDFWYAPSATVAETPFWFNAVNTICKQGASGGTVDHAFGNLSNDPVTIYASIGIVGLKPDNNNGAVTLQAQALQ
jgi:hypothetical protein